MMNKSLSNTELSSSPDSQGNVFYQYGKSWDFIKVPYEWNEEGKQIQWIEQGYEYWKSFYQKLSDKRKGEINELFAHFPLNDYEQW